MRNDKKRGANRGVGKKPRGGGGELEGQSIM